MYICLTSITLMVAGGLEPIPAAWRQQEMGYTL